MFTLLNRLFLIAYLPVQEHFTRPCHNDSLLAAGHCGIKYSLCLPKVAGFHVHVMPIPFGVGIDHMRQVSLLILGILPIGNEIRRNGDVTHMIKLLLSGADLC